MPYVPSYLLPVSGTLLNALTVLVGGTIGALIGNRLPERMHDSLFSALGLFTILIGLIDAIATKNPLILLGALLIGTVIGEALNIDGGLRAVGDFFQARLSGMGSTISEAFVTSSLVFCVGPLTILGSLDNGLTGDSTKLVIKSTLDGFAALAFGATLGWGVLLSVITILLFQGAISLSAQALAPVLGPGSETLVELTATGGIILVAIGLRLLKIRELRTANFLPALVVAPLLVAAVSLWQTYVH
jgi:uncharacterized membrane protein YqgA involved in biofilm formation